MLERRRLQRQPVELRARFRIVQEGARTQYSEPVEAKITNLTMDGAALETPCVEADGLHISYNEDPARRNEVYLQCELPTGESLRAVGQTIWYERVTPGAPSSYLVALKFRQIPESNRKALRDYLESAA